MFAMCLHSAFHGPGTVLLARCELHVQGKGAWLHAAHTDSFSRLPPSSSSVVVTLNCDSFLLIASKGLHPGACIFLQVPAACGSPGLQPQRSTCTGNNHMQYPFSNSLMGFTLACGERMQTLPLRKPNSHVQVPARAQRLASRKHICPFREDFLAELQVHDVGEVRPPVSLDAESGIVFHRRQPT